MKAISKLRFNSLAGYVRDAVLLVTVEELEWDQEGNEKVLGVVVRDVFDNDFGYVVLGRDALKHFRAVDLGHSLTSRKRARTMLRGKLAKWAKTNHRIFIRAMKKKSRWISSGQL